MDKPDTADFLRRVLPRQGVLCAAKLETGAHERWWRNTPHADVDALAARLKATDASQCDAYMALAGFGERVSDASKGRPRFRRTQENAQWFRALWLDIDVKPDREDAYATREEAANAINAFLRDTKLPWPLVVDSGHGFHLYWPFSEDLPYKVWHNAARILKALTIGMGLKADHACTADASRVLRPVGTRNWKQPDDPRDVRLLRENDPYTDRELIERLVQAATPYKSLVVQHANGTHPPHSTHVSGAFDVSLPKAVEPVFRGCRQIREAPFESEEIWRGMLSVVRLCERGDEWCHLFSKQDTARYRPKDTDAKLATLARQQGAGGMPMTCATFNEKRSGICPQCPHWQTIRSPVVLGLGGHQHQDAAALSPRTGAAPTPVSQASTEGDAGAAENDGQAVARLAALPLMEYDRVRRDEAKRLGVQVSTLDKLVDSARPDEKPEDGEDDEDNGRLFPKVEPWDGPVDGAALLDAITATIRRFVVCDEPVAQAAALWVVMTWLMDVVNVAPLAVITSPEKRCGKTQFLAVLSRLVYRPLTAGNISPAAVFRSIERWKPTLLLDEADTYMRENEQLRGVLDCGHTRDTAYVLRVEGDNFVPRCFSVWAAKAVAGIGKVSDTVSDRSIVLPMHRKLPHERAEKLRHAGDNLFDTLKSKIARWVGDNRQAVRVARLALPDVLNDRAADNWEPLCQIAEVAGGGWEALAESAALVLSGEDEQSQGRGATLLAAVRTVFDVWEDQRISMVDLLGELCRNVEAPWATWNRGRPMTTRQLGQMLAPFGIHSQTVKTASGAPKGYKREQFADAFARYLGSSPEKGGDRVAEETSASGTGEA
ncbi:hypothetical protein PUN4_360008 [Paraburkholderia unamae]|uniref:DUF3631 domain-containing protein n=1 Tax=Paraburkholderia unamae TaxID=219649 RepID=UPI001CAC6F4B|nr:DUF3631 domain-containing protein [Paraburkholderia unamae]CAG9260935.1 hypothetical protein PUN4_360008 [Paraburkholderia unamae]